MHCELALLQEAIADMQQEQNSLQNLIAKQEETLARMRMDSSNAQACLSQLANGKKLEAEREAVLPETVRSLHITERIGRQTSCLIGFWIAGEVG